VRRELSVRSPDFGKGEKDFQSGEAVVAAFAIVDIWKACQSGQGERGQNFQNGQNNRKRKQFRGKKFSSDHKRRSKGLGKRKGEGGKSGD